MEDKLKIHGSYIILILMAVIVVLATVQWATIPDLANYLTFALTLASMLLALLAIIYAYFSNSSLSKSTTMLEGSAREVRSASDEVKQATHLLQVHLASVPEDIRGLSSRVDQTYSAVAKLLQAPITPLPSETRKVTDEFVRSYLEASSPLGILTLYACALANKKGVPLDLSTLSNRLNYGDDDYMMAYIIASAAAGVLTHQFMDDNVVIREIHPLVAAVSKELYVGFHGRVRNRDYQAWAANVLQIVEGFLDETPTP